MLRPTNPLELIRPDWALPPGVSAAVTTREGGVSEAGYQSLNLAGHVGDAAVHVAENRRRLQQALGLTEQPLWLNQVHGVEVAEAGRDEQNVTADAVVSTQPGIAAAVLTADCLPVLFCGQTPKHEPIVAAAHAGWRGLAAGVLEQTVAKMACDPSLISCWLGPAIGPTVFQVGAEVKAAFIDQQPEAATAFVADGADKYLADLYQLARLRLNRAGVATVVGGDFCTVQDSRFFSYRRAGNDADGRPVPCGRFASLIWINPS